MFKILKDFKSIFEISDVDKLRDQLRSRPERSLEWQTKLSTEQKNLQQEMVDHNDIISVDVVDHYRNIPLKLLKYLSRLREGHIISLSKLYS